MKRLVVVAGALSQQPRQGGLAWLHVQFLKAFERLGCRVLFVDRVEPEVCVDHRTQPSRFAESANLGYFRQVMGAFGLGGRSALIYNRGEIVVGRTKEQLLREVAEADILLNVMGYLDDEEILGVVKRRVFVDIDPGFPQMWRELGLHDAFQGHTDFVSLGRNIGRPDCTIPTCGLKWVTMPQPVVLDHWPAQPPKPEGAFTSIGAWRGPNAPIEYQGHTYGLRAHEFRKFVELPERVKGTKTRFEMALDIHPADVKDIELLKSNGWEIADPKEVAGGPEEYRSYLAGSKAELMVPKQMYVDTKSGLLSDRSVYYLASGRPVLARETGIKHFYPTGRGLLTFSTLDEAVAGVEEINGNYARHCKAAREIAEEYFDSDKVLAKLLADLDIGS